LIFKTSPEVFHANKFGISETHIRVCKADEDQDLQVKRVAVEANSPPRSDREAVEAYRPTRLGRRLKTSTENTPSSVLIYRK
jgi:hypothetical protein